MLVDFMKVARIVVERFWGWILWLEDLWNGRCCWKMVLISSLLCEDWSNGCVVMILMPAFRNRKV